MKVLLDGGGAILVVLTANLTFILIVGKDLLINSLFSFS
jgi:hypothetical protein